MREQPSTPLFHEQYGGGVAAAFLREKPLAVAAQLAREILRHRVGAVVADDVVDAVA